ncbi:MAG: hypothetical protein RH982_17955 [Parvibaculum sp.]|uniref:hypothetical protein n=1 Tax=Parvibaculum sp. TaxID=2024848 RepID=UPI0032EC50E5
MLTKMRPELAETAPGWKQTGAHRLRVGAAIAIFAMAACADEAASDRNAQRDAGATETSTAPSATTPGIAIAALSGVPDAEANIFATLLKEEAAKMRLPVANGGAGTYEVSGAMGAGKNADGAYVVTVIDVRDASGERVHRVVNEETLPLRAEGGDPWASIGPAHLRRIASDAASKLAVWYAGEIEAQGGMQAAAENNDAVVTGSIAPGTAQAPLPQTNNRLPFKVVVGAAPGDGNQALSRALDNALARRVPTATWLRDDGYKIEGSVVTASRADGRTDVSIRWVVTSADGETLGEVNQKNALDAARIAGNWGKLAESAAEAAAEGVMALLAPPRGQS